MHDQLNCLFCELQLFHFYDPIKQTGELCRCSEQQRTYLIYLLTSSDMSVLHASHVYWPIPSPTIKILLRNHPEHELWTPHMWSVPLDRCSPVFSVRDKIFQKVTNWSALAPEIISEQRDLCPTMKNCGLWPLGPSILDPIYVFYAFGSMLSCILCERPTFSESHKLKPFDDRNQFRAAGFVTVSFIGCSLNAMELMVLN